MSNFARASGRDAVVRQRETERLVRRKMARLQGGTGSKPRVLDLFSGCGGISLGFHAAGCEIVAAVEFDEHAAGSHGANFHPGHKCHGRARDITLTPPHELNHQLGLGEPEESFDIIVGGPPCQAFARVGRSKLREVAEHPEAFRHDTRARLYIDYLEYVRVCKPLAVVLENVPDMLNFGGHNIANEVCEALSALGYTCSYTLLNAAFFGVPQMRERAFLVGIRREITDRIVFPAATHWIELPPGYEGSRAVARKLLANSDTHGADNFWQPISESNPHLVSAVTIEEALQDLPPIYARTEMASGGLRRGARRFDVLVPYPRVKKLSAYARVMREWPGLDVPLALSDHVIRYLPRDYKLFARMEPGTQYPEALKLSLRMFEEALEVRRKNGESLSEGTTAWKKLRSSIVPPYDHTKFPNKWRKMERDKPARTLMAHLGKDSYSHIHYDSEQARTISVREAARLQSFPDSFTFKGTMNPAFRQIGNAVPPLLAKAVATQLLSQIKNTRSIQSELVA